MSIVSDTGNPLQPQLDITKTTPVICKCGNHTFTHGVFLRDVSAIASPTGKAGTVPIPTFTCNACGAVPDKVLPPFLRAEAAGNSTTPAETVPPTPSFEKSSLKLI